MSIIVIKIGGEIIDHKERMQLFVNECAAIQQNTEHKLVIVHGGGKQISALSARLGIEPQFVNGLRMTSASEMSVVQMVLAGDVNSIVVRALQERGLLVTGVSGVSAGLLLAEPTEGAAGGGATAGGGTAASGGVIDYKQKDNDIGINFTATSVVCNPQLLQVLLQHEYIPVVAPICLNPNDHAPYNANADTAAVAIAHSLEAELLFVTDVPGVLDNNGAIIKHIGRDNYLRLIEGEIVKGGMRAKLSACFSDKYRNKKIKAVIGMVQQEGDMISLINSTIGTLVSNEN